MKNVAYISSLIWIAVFVLDLAAILLALSRRRGVEVTLAWLFAILALPGVGALAYFGLAERRVKRTARRKLRARAAVRRIIGEGACDAAGGAEVEQTCASILQLAAALTDMAPTAGNAVELLARDSLAFAQIENALLSAERSIWAEYYLINDDDTGRRFLETLTLKAREGVEVRLLYDAIGSFSINGKLVAALEAAGGRTAVFLPLNPLRRRWSLNLRNHRKLIVVDNAIGFTGGMNVGDEYSGRARRRGRNAFRDAHLSLRGPAVDELAQVFREDWSFAASEALAPPPPAKPADNGRAIVAIVPSGPDQEFNANAMVYFTGIAAARERVWIATPYFIPDEPTLRALVSAAQRGVDVRLLLPQRNDIRLIGVAARSYFPELVRHGVRVFQYRPSWLHAKAMTVDGTWALVGSANVDVRSFQLNFEVGALIVEREFAARVAEQFAVDQAQADELTPATFAAQSFLARLRDGLARLLSPLL